MRKVNFIYRKDENFLCEEEMEYPKGTEDYEIDKDFDKWIEEKDKYIENTWEDVEG